MSLAPNSRIQIARGNPTAEEIAAVLVALDQEAGEIAIISAGQPQPPWQRAARLEGLGGAPPSSADDPRLRPR
jgi:Acyl-CoA carboxylase epsilon subunit